MLLNFNLLPTKEGADLPDLENGEQRCYRGVCKIWNVDKKAAHRLYRTREKPFLKGVAKTDVKWM